MQRYLLDSGILVGLVRQAKWATRIRARLESPIARLDTSIICQGELLAAAEKFEWGARILEELEKLLGEIPSFDIYHPDILKAYAHIDTWTHGKKLSDPELPLPPKPARPMKQNDIRIAATAYATSATLVSADKDFLHLKNTWVDFIYVSQDLGSTEL